MRLPPAVKTDSAANCGDPAKAVADIAMAAPAVSPDFRAMYPKTTPSAPIANASGATSRAPVQYPFQLRDELIVRRPSPASMFAIAIFAVRNIAWIICGRKYPALNCVNE